MGLFSGKTIVNTELAVAPMFDKTPNRRKQALTEAILAGTSIVEATNRSVTGGVQDSMVKMLKYAQSPDYVYGTPTITSSTDGITYPVELIETLRTYPVPQTPPLVTNTEIRIEYYNYVSAELSATDPIIRDQMLNYYVYNKLASEDSNNYGVNWNGNNLTLNGLPVTVQYFANYSSGSLSSYLAYVYLGGTFYKQYSGLPAITEKLVYDPNTYAYPHVHVCKFVKVFTYSENGVSKTLTTYSNYFMYWENVNGYTFLNRPTKVNLQKDLYPVIPIRYDNASISAIGGSQFNSVKDILNILNISVTDIENAVNSSPDIAYVRDANIMFGVSTVDDTESNIYALARTLQLLKENSIYSNPTDKEFNEIDIEEGNFKYSVKYKYVTSYMIQGEYTMKDWWNDGNVEIPDGGTWEYVSAGDSDPYLTYVPKYWVNTCMRVIVPVGTVGFEGYSNVYEIYGLVTTYGIQVGNTLYAKEYLLGNPEVILPLIDEVITMVPAKYRDDVIYKSMHLVISAVQYTKLAWYQTGAFKVILAAITVALVIVNPALVTLYTTIMAGGTAALIALATTIGTYLITSSVTEWLVDKYNKLGVLLAIVFNVLMTGNINNISANIVDTLHKIYTATIDVVKVYQQNAYSKVIELTDSFDVKYKDKLAEVEELQDKLNNGIPIDLLSVYSISRPSKLVQNETPEEFYNRTSTTLDLPMLTNSMVTNYYEAQLQLPKFINTNEGDN